MPIETKRWVRALDARENQKLMYQTTPDASENPVSLWSSSFSSSNASEGRGRKRAHSPRSLVNAKMMRLEAIKSQVDVVIEMLTEFKNSL